MPFPQLTRVALENYRSIRQCSAALSPLTFLVGPNGSGKSNFFDALAFTSEALSTSLASAIRDRGGMASLAHRQGEGASSFGVRLEFTLADATRGHYAYRIRRAEKYAYEVEKEEFSVQEGSTGLPPNFVVNSGVVESADPLLGKRVISTDRLFLPSASGLLVFKPVHDLLSHVMVYNPDTNRMRETIAPGDGLMLLSNGANFADALANLRETRPDSMAVLVSYLQKIHPLIESIDVSLDEQNDVRWVSFAERYVPSGVRSMGAAMMSYGTLRALAILIALFQPPLQEGGASVVCIEEPEIGLHPFASGAVRDAFREASDKRQVLVSSHSPDLLDDKDISSDCLLAVTVDDGSTRIGPVANGARGVLHEHLYTAGEMLRQNLLKPAVSNGTSAEMDGTRLFSEG